MPLAHFEKRFRDHVNDEMNNEINYIQYSVKNYILDGIVFQWKVLYFNFFSNKRLEEVIESLYLC